MATTVYGKTKSISGYSIRSKVVYTVNTYDTYITITGTMYFQANVTTANSKIFVYGMGLALSDTSSPPDDIYSQGVGAYYGLMAGGTILGPNSYGVYESKSETWFTYGLGGGWESTSTKTVTQANTWVDLVSKTFTIGAAGDIPRQSSARTIYLAHEVDGFKNQLDGETIGTWQGQVALTSITIPALPTYSVTYNANGGSGTTASQTKTYGQALTLRANGFTRSGFSFKRWNTNTTDTGTAYNASSSYTGNAALSLYAIWNRTVMFNANGGTGAPSAQTAVATSAITLSSAIPSFSGYSFKRWNTNTSDTGTAYNSGGSYPANSASTTLYAIWNRTVTYNANGGGTAPAPQTELKTSAITLASAMQRDGYAFLRWNTEPDGSGTDYQAGATYAANNPSMTLYAIWWKNITVDTPTMTRCDAQGVADECGGYVKVSFNWAVESGQGVVSEDARLTIQLEGDGASFSYTETQSGASGSLTRVMGDGTLSPMTTCTATATCTDENSTVRATATLGASQSYYAPRVTRAVATLTNSSGQGNYLGKYVSVTVNYDVYSSASQESAQSIAVNLNHGGQTASREVEDVPLVGSQTWIFGPYGYDSFDPHGDYQVGTLTVTDNFNSTTVPVRVSATGYVNPIISGISAYRVNPVSHGGTTSYEEADDGTSLGIDIGWYVYGAQGQRPVISIDVIEMLTGDVVATRIYDDWAVTEASSRIFIEAQEGDTHPEEGLLDTGKQYLVTATLSDVYSAVVTSAKATISEAVSNSFFTMDFLAGGHGVGIGKASSRPVFDVGMQAQFDKPIQVADQVSLPTYTFATIPQQGDIPTGPAFIMTEDDNAVYYYDGTPDGVMVGGGGGIATTQGEIQLPLSISNGGTGASNAETALSNLGAGELASMNTAPIANGGTGATTAADALANLGALSRVWDASQIPNLPASKTTSGTFSVDRIPTLTAEKIPNLSASKITSDTLPVARGGTGVTGSSSSSISTGVVLQKYGKLCVLTIDRSCALSSSWATVSIGTIPSGSRPITETHGVVVVENTSGKCAEVSVTTAGAATINAMGGETLGTQYVHGSVAWICA